MGEGDMVQLRMTRSVTKDVFEKTVEFLAFVVLAKEVHDNQYFLKARQTL